jgi:hypothetical protein
MARAMVRSGSLAAIYSAPYEISDCWPGGDARRAVRMALLELELAGRVEYLADRTALCVSANQI